MTYSFSAKGNSKTDAILDVDAKMDKLCEDMPVHLKDRELVSAHMRNVVNSLADPDYSEQVVVSMHGYITRTCDRIVGISAAVSAALVVKK